MSFCVLQLFLLACVLRFRGHNWTAHDYHNVFSTKYIFFLMYSVLAIVSVMPVCLHFSGHFVMVNLYMNKLWIVFRKSGLQMIAKYCYLFWNIFVFEWRNVLEVGCKVLSFCLNIFLHKGFTHLHFSNLSSFLMFISWILSVSLCWNWDKNALISKMAMRIKYI